MRLRRRLSVSGDPESGTEGSLETVAVELGAEMDMDWSAVRVTASASLRVRDSGSTSVTALVLALPNSRYSKPVDETYGTSKTRWFGVESVSEAGVHVVAELQELLGKLLIVLLKV